MSLGLGTVHEVNDALNTAIYSLVTGHAVSTVRNRVPKGQGEFRVVGLDAAPAELHLDSAAAHSYALAEVGSPLRNRG